MDAGKSPSHLWLFALSILTYLNHRAFPVEQSYGGWTPVILRSVGYLELLGNCGSQASRVPWPQTSKPAGSVLDDRVIWLPQQNSRERTRPEIQHWSWGPSESCQVSYASNQSFTHVKSPYNENRLMSLTVLGDGPVLDKSFLYGQWC